MRELWAEVSNSSCLQQSGSSYQQLSVIQKARYKTAERVLQRASVLSPGGSCFPAPADYCLVKNTGIHLTTSSDLREAGSLGY